MSLLDDDELINTPHQIASRLHVSEEEVLAILESGAIKGFRVGPHWRIQEREFKAYVKDSVRAREAEVSDAREAEVERVLQAIADDDPESKSGDAKAPNVLPFPERPQE